MTDAEINISEYREILEGWEQDVIDAEQAQALALARLVEATNQLVSSRDHVRKMREAIAEAERLVSK